MISEEYALEEEKRIAVESNRWFKSIPSLIMTIVSIFITIFIFWKVNIPLIDIFT